MTYLELIKDFWKEHDNEPFTPLATLLYFRLLEESNRKRWENPFSVSSKKLETSVCKSRKMLSKVREELKERGLIDFTSRKGLATVFLLLKTELKTADSEDVSAAQKEGQNYPENTPENHPENDLKNGSKIGQKMFPTETTDVSHRNNFDKKMFPTETTDVSHRNNYTLYIEPKGSLEDCIEDCIGQSTATAVEEKRPEIFDEIEGLKSDEIWLSNICSMHRKKRDEILKFLPRFAESCICDGIVCHRDEKDLKNHFNRWLRFQKQPIDDGKQKQDRFSERRGFVPETEVRKGFKATL